MKVIIYSGPNCCLCDQAFDLLNNVNIVGLNIEKVNVRDSTELYHLYGARIPVVKRDHDSTELAWPFTSEALHAFLS